MRDFLLPRIARVRDERMIEGFPVDVLRMRRQPPLQRDREIIVAAVRHSRTPPAAAQQMQIARRARLMQIKRRRSVIGELPDPRRIARSAAAIHISPGD
jgi:hypothetical protein